MAKLHFFKNVLGQQQILSQGLPQYLLTPCTSVIRSRNVSSLIPMQGLYSSHIFNVHW